MSPGFVLRVLGVLAGILIAIITLSDWLLRLLPSDLAVRIKLLAMLLAWTSFIIAIWSASDILRWKEKGSQNATKRYPRA